MAPRFAQAPTSLTHLALAFALVAGGHLAGCQSDRKSGGETTGSVGAGTVESNTSAAGGGQTGQGGQGGQGGLGGQGGQGGQGDEVTPNCSCLLAQFDAGTCGSCVSFALVDGCEPVYRACQEDPGCVAVDECVFASQCQDSLCLEDCRTGQSSLSLSIYDAMMTCACDTCSECNDSEGCFAN